MSYFFRIYAVYEINISEKVIDCFQQNFDLFKSQTMTLLIKYKELRNN